MLNFFGSRYFQNNNLTYCGKWLGNKDSYIIFLLSILNYSQVIKISIRSLLHVFEVEKYTFWKFKELELSGAYHFLKREWLRRITDGTL